MDGSSKDAIPSTQLLPFPQAEHEEIVLESNKLR